MSLLASTPKPPYYAVIFTSIRTEGDNGYGETATRMAKLAERQPGYLGEDSARSEIGITVSYWADLESIKNWKANYYIYFFYFTGKLNVTAAAELLQTNDCITSHVFFKKSISKSAKNILEEGHSIQMK